MKKLLFKALVLSAAIVLTVSQIVASQWEWGFKAGILRSEADFSHNLPFITLGPIDELSFGSYLSYFFIKGQLGLQPEINYSVKGFEVLEEDLGQDVSSKYKISYLEIPVLIAYRFPLNGRFKPGLVAGPYVGFAHKVQEVQTAFGTMEKRELDDNLKKTNIGLVFGGNVQYRLGSMNVLLSVRYYFGLTNISKNIEDVSYDFRENDTIKNRAFSVSLGIALIPKASH